MHFSAADYPVLAAYLIGLGPRAQVLRPGVKPERIGTPTYTASLRGL